MTFLKPYAFCLLLLVLSLGTNCQRDGSARNPTRSAQLKLRASQNRFTYGDSLRFEYDTKTKADSLRIVVSGRPFTSLIPQSEAGSFAIPSQFTGGGTVSVKLEALLEGKWVNTIKSVRVVAKESPRNLSFEIVNRYPHSTEAFTQGLLFYNNNLYEGTGNVGESFVRQVNLLTGQAVAETPTPNDYFGEGITIFDNKLYQLTYKDGKCVRYNLQSLEPEHEFITSFATGEGWGLTHNDTSLIASDGSANLYFINPADFSIIKTMRVFDDKGDVIQLNELEYRDGKVYANIFTQPLIAIIDVSTGRVTDYLDCRGIITREEIKGNIDVLNGIAAMPGSDHLLVTGKYWPFYYEIALIQEDS